MYQKFNCFLSKHQTNIFRILFGGWIIWLLLYWARVAYVFTPSYQTWAISDWMINYEGGFVRRGLLGEILYLLYQVHPFSIYHATLCLAIASTICLVITTIRIFWKEGWSLIIIPSSLMFAQSWLFPMWMRRDHWALLITFCIFFLYKAFLTHQKKCILCSFQLLSIATILIHEASFFFTIPIIGIHYFYHQFNRTKKWISSCINTLLFFSPSILTMAIVCLSKGNIHIAETIWNSWAPAMEAYPLSTSTGIGAGVDALTWETIPTFGFHFHSDWMGLFYKFIPSFPFTLLNFLGIYYFVTRLNTVDLGCNRLKKFNRTQISNILLLQFIFMLPMFTILSCDFGRTIPYWVISSIFAFHYFKNHTYFPAWTTKASIKIQSFMDQLSILNNPWFYSIALICIPISSVGGSTLSGSFIGMIYYDIMIIIKHLF